MGLNFSIKTYVNKNDLSKSLKWLLNNTLEYDKPLKLKIDNEILRINGDSFRKTSSGYSFAEDKNGNINLDLVVEEFTKLSFSTCLLFDMDPLIIKSLADYNIYYRTEALDEFRDMFESAYLGNGKIRIGNFDTTIFKIKGQNVYEFEFVAVTSDISSLISDSPSVKKWILEFSKESNSILTYTDLEYNGHRILYYRGKEIDIIIKNGFDDEYNSHSENISFAQNFITEYYNIKKDTQIQIY